MSIVINLDAVSYTHLFCVYGIGSKLYTDLDDYELSDYICFDFLLDW